MVAKSFNNAVVMSIHLIKRIEKYMTKWMRLYMEWRTVIPHLLKYEKYPPPSDKVSQLVPKRRNKTDQN